MRALHKLSSAKVRNAAHGKYSDGVGLWFHKRPDGGAQWFLRVTVYGNLREMGLGPYPTVTQKDAREEADKWRAVVRQNKDPIKERERQRRKAAKEQFTLETVAEQAFEARKGDGVAGRRFTPLKLHILPKLGRIPIEEIDQKDIRNTLAPIWHTKADTAKKAISRLSIVMRYGAAMDVNVGLQATEKAKELLGRSRRVARNVRAMPWSEVPAFYAGLVDSTPTQLALRLLILTAARSTPVRHARLDEINGDTWTIPAEKMKSLKGREEEFRIPLSREALAVIEQAKPLARDGFLFPSVRRGVISDATMGRYMERLGMDARPHGFRSSFRTWCAEATGTSREVAQTALAHAVGSSVEPAYKRTDFLPQRHVLMKLWADHVTRGTGEVVKKV